MIRLEIKNCNTILRETQPKDQHYHQLKLTKYEYITGEETFPSNKSQMLEQTKFVYSPLGKAFEKQRKTDEDQGRCLLKLNKLKL